MIIKFFPFCFYVDKVLNLTQHNLVVILLVGLKIPSITREDEYVVMIDYDEYVVLGDYPALFL